MYDMTILTEQWHKTCVQSVNYLVVTVALVWNLVSYNKKLMQKLCIAIWKYLSINLLSASQNCSRQYSNYFFFFFRENKMAFHVNHHKISQS